MAVRKYIVDKIVCSIYIIQFERYLLFNALFSDLKLQILLSIQALNKKNRFKQNWERLADIW